MIALGEMQQGRGISRGPGEAPMSLEADPTDLGTANIEGVANADMSRALPGDLIGETTLDEAPEVAGDGGSIKAGAVRSPGSGGAQVWKERYLPEEQAVLETYFQ